MDGSPTRCHVLRIKKPEAYTMGNPDTDAQKFIKQMAVGESECSRFRSYPGDKEGLTHWTNKQECIRRHLHYRHAGPSYHPCAICSSAATWTRYAERARRLQEIEDQVKEEAMKTKKCNLCGKVKPVSEFVSLATGQEIKSCQKCQGYWSKGSPAPAIKSSDPIEDPLEMKEVPQYEPAVEQPEPELCEEPPVKCGTMKRIQEKIEQKDEESMNFDFEQFPGMVTRRHSAPRVTIRRQHGKKSRLMYISSSAVLEFGMIGRDLPNTHLRFFYDRDARVIGIQPTRDAEADTMKATLKGGSAQCSVQSFTAWAGVKDLGTFDLEQIKPDLWIIRLDEQKQEAA